MTPVIKRRKQPFNNDSTKVSNADNPDIDVQPCCWRSIHSLLQHGHRCVSAQAARVDIQNWSSPKNLFHCRMMEVSP